MPFMRELTVLEPMAAVRAVSETLRRIDPRLMDHGERVAFLACALRDAGQLDLDEKSLLLLSVFHDIGAYKTDEIDRMVEFETRDVWDHSIYGYLFLKYMTPLQERAEAILYHHSSWADIVASGTACGDYAAPIHLADRIDIAAGYGPDSPQLASVCGNDQGLFRPEYAALFNRVQGPLGLLRQLEDGSYRQVLEQRVRRLALSPQETMDYLKMIVFSIDFRSEYTVTHTINTVSLSLNTAQHFGLSQPQQEQIYVGAYLHDVGKVAVPLEILEYPGRLSPEQMAVMRTHVSESRHLIEGFVPQEICEIAVRHHEKLDGTGYPQGLTASELTFPQRIVAVADIVSALASRRSYKDPFPKEKTLSILAQMSGNQLDAGICAYVCQQYDAILQETDISRAGVIRRYQAMSEEFLRLSRQLTQNGTL